MTKQTRRRWFPIFAAVAGYLIGLFIFVSPSGLVGRAQDQGPQPNVGETVLKPKKTQPNQPAPTPAPGKKPERINPADIYTLSTSTNLVNVDVLVTTEGGQPIPGLRKDNFRVYDDGTQQTITNFGISKAPMTVTMLIEFSRLFWGFDYLALRDSYGFLNFMQPQDWVAAIYYDMNQHILTDFTHDRNELRSDLDTLRIPEFSENNLYDSLAFSLDRMKNIQGRKAILLISTGCDSFSKLNYGEMLKIVKDSDTVIYPISTLEFVTIRYGQNFPCTPGMRGYGSSMDSLQARNALNTIAKYTGGQAYFPRFEQDIPSIYQQIAGQLRTQYSLGFVPTDPTKDGKYHKLRVDVIGPQGQPLEIHNQKGKKIKYRVVSRQGYYAPKS